MRDFTALRVTAFQMERIVASGRLDAVALAVREKAEAAPQHPILVFDNDTGGVIDLDLRGSDAEIIGRLRQRNAAGQSGSDTGSLQVEQPATRRGRPKLGVVAREVTLLPRHWEWLAAQPGGASNALRRLTESAMRADGSVARRRARQEAAYRFMAAMAGNFAGFEEAIRALFADDSNRFAEHIAGWPTDIAGYARRLAWSDEASG